VSTYQNGRVYKSARVFPLHLLTFLAPKGVYHVFAKSAEWKSGGGDKTLSYHCATDIRTKCVSVSQKVCALNGAQLPAGLVIEMVIYRMKWTSLTTMTTVAGIPASCSTGIRPYRGMTAYGPSRRAEQSVSR